MSSTVALGKNWQKKSPRYIYIYIYNWFHYDSCNYDFINFDEANQLDSHDKFLA